MLNEPAGEADKTEVIFKGSGSIRVNAGKEAEGCSLNIHPLTSFISHTYVPVVRFEISCVVALKETESVQK